MAINESDVYRRSAVKHDDELKKLTHNITNVSFKNPDGEILHLKDFMKVSSRTYVITDNGIIVVDEQENFLLGYDNYIITLVKSLHFEQLGSVRNPALVNYLNYILGSCMPQDDISISRLAILKKSKRSGRT